MELLPEQTPHSVEHDKHSALLLNHEGDEVTLGVNGWEDSWITLANRATKQNLGFKQKLQEAKEFPGCYY